METDVSNNNVADISHGATDLSHSPDSNVGKENLEKASAHHDTVEASAGKRDNNTGLLNESVGEGIVGKGGEGGDDVDTEVSKTMKKMNDGNNGDIPGQGNQAASNCVNEDDACHEKTTIYDGDNTTRDKLKTINKCLTADKINEGTEDMATSKGDDKTDFSTVKDQEKVTGGMSSAKDVVGITDNRNVESASTSSVETIGQVPDKPIKYKCPKCSRVMKDKKLLENHSCDGETEEIKVKITIELAADKKSFLCKECDYTSTGHSFEEHLMCHLMVRPYQCLYCKECFINRKEISRHVVKSHGGAKMSCALRALKKAKSLIKEVSSSGMITFSAKVAGKVPLEKDPDKKKKLESGNTEAKETVVTESGQGVQKLEESNEDNKKIEMEPDQGGQKLENHNTESKEINKAVVMQLEKNGQILEDGSTESNETNEKMVLGMEQSGSNLSDIGESSPNLSDMDQSGPNLSDKDNGGQISAGDKVEESLPVSVNHRNVDDSCSLRSAQTPESSENNSKASKSDLEADVSEPESCSNSNSESGLKIVATFSFNKIDTQVLDSEEATGKSAALQPNFIISPEVNTEKDTEVLSFLGPEKPIFKANDSNFTDMLPPPPLQHAPFQSSASSSQTQPAALKQSGRDSNFFVCGFNCLFSSMSTTDFREHTVNFHSTETYFPCFYCGHRSPNETDLVRHISNHTLTHNNSSPLYVCGNSGCRFGTNMVADYISHVRASHPDVPELVCCSCGDTFSEANMLQTHVEDNVIHIVNCPHCPSKATDRRAILNHISSAHPGKPKMVSVAKQLICHDRKLNNYWQVSHLGEMLPPALTPAPGHGTHGSVGDQISSRHDFSVSCSDGMTPRSSLSPKDSPSPSYRQKDTTPESEKSPNSESSDFDSVRVKEEMAEDPDGNAESGGGEDARTAYIVDENGVRRRVYIPMSERRAENYRCKHCTFIARDFKRMHCHERSHGMPPSRKERFKCMFCPQGFDSELKFRLHITCHPGLIKFLLYRCKKCEFDTNQKHTIIRHITCNRDRKHRGFGALEEQYSVVSRSLESRVIECERCDYMTRHKIHMAIHYQRKHNILKDKGEFTIENLMPTDTPLSSYGHAVPEKSPSSTSLHSSLHSPDSSRDDSFDFTKPVGSPKKSKMLDSPASHITERNEQFTRMVSQQAALQSGQTQENQMRKFKCPICKYLLPKAADLKHHVKRHSEIGQITLVMFRCKYCSYMSTARELIYDHLTEKHQGKSIALVKKIIAIDTNDAENSFAETTIEETLDQLEESLHKEMLASGSLASGDGLLSSSYEQLFVIPESGETFDVPLQCPTCSFSSSIKSEIIEHVTSLHPQVKVIGSDEDVDKLARATSEGIQQVTKPRDGPEDVLILPDDQIFSEYALCSRCDFKTVVRKEMVLHLQQFHPEVSIMGRNSYPVQVTAVGRPTGTVDESCVVGSGSLDAKLRCLYENYGTQMKCMICGAERPKKFFIHVHILRHLNIYLWKCAFCSHRGLQKYKMVDHIKKIHGGKPLSVRYLRVNVEEKVSDFLSQFSVNKNRKDSLDESGYGPYTSVPEELTDQTSNDSNRSRQKSPGPGSNVGNNCPHSLGSDELDEKISCMYDCLDASFFKCRACPNQFQRKFAMHRHIIISHLKVALLSCAYCGMEGVERHQLVDHILACHKPAPISILTLDIDLQKMAADYMARLAAKEQGDEDTKRGISFKAEAGYGQNTYYPSNKTLGFGSVKSLKPPIFRFGNKSPGASSGKKAIVDPDVVMLGRHALDVMLNCLYQERPTGQLRCLVCRWEFPRKYPLHRHIMLRHLKMNLVGCPYCPFEGIEKYNVSTHIKETHKDMPITIKFMQPDVETRVRQFVDDMASIGGKCQEVLIQKPVTKSMVVMPSLDSDDDDNDKNSEADDNQDDAENDRSPRGGLVVAMFGKKKTTDDFVVKTEIDDEAYEEGTALQTNDDGEDDDGNNNDESTNNDDDNNYDENNYQEDYNEDDDPGADKSDYEPSSSSEFSPPKYPPMHSYVPGSYRSPAGGKAKALDVITKIKVLQTKEGPIKKFYCEKCNFTSLHRSNIVRHIYKIHEKYQTHTCPLCNYQTLSVMLMQKHIEKAHRGGLGNEEAFTQSPSPSKSIMGPLSFKKKKQSFFGNAPEKPTLSNSGTTRPKHYACAYCYYETNTQEDILQHTRENHSQGDVNTQKSPVSEHSTNKSDDPVSACWDGSKKAVKRKWQDGGEGGIIKRKRRFIFEKGTELIQCGHCETKETSVERMQDHMTWDHPGLAFQAKQIPAWRFICKSCSVKTMATSKMKYHLNRHINYRPYTCMTCGAFFPSPDQCRRHSRSQAHEEQYTYVRNPKKEARVDELLEGTRQLALKVQEEAAKNPDFDISQTDSFIAQFQESKSNLRKNIHSANINKSKKAAETNGEGATDEEAKSKKQPGKSQQTLGVEQDITIKCYNCDFTAGNVSSVSTHHKEAHPGKKFLWTEIERGFTCDSTGEALIDCDSVPGASSDVGYTTRMTLGSGNNTMRFKCKTCDFSSYVIQAMKSHLKSHQPKGFICPYCSRSFSGKEKLMRHQYCLHKGQALWVIHLRRSGVAGSLSLKKCKGASSRDISAAASREEEDTPLDEEAPVNESDEAEESSEVTSQGLTKYFCCACPYATESLYHFRLHLAQEHEEFKHKIQATSVDSDLMCAHCPFIAETESELSCHLETHNNSQNFHCAYCTFTNSDRPRVEQHLTTYHSSLEPKILEINSTEKQEEQNGKGGPLLVNLEPQVTVERIPESVLTQYARVELEASGSSSDEEVSSDYGEHASDSGDGESLQHKKSAEDSSSIICDNFDENSKLGLAANEEKSNSSSKSVNSGSAGSNAEGNSDSNLNMPADSDELARELGLVEDETSCVLGPESDMIVHFGGIASNNGSEDSISDGQDGNEDREEDEDLKSPPDQGGSSVFCSKDTTLFAAQENGDGDDDDGEIATFENDVMLASPLPMISLGDGVSVSPVTMEASVDSDDDNDEPMDVESEATLKDVDTNSEMLLDL